MQPIRFFALTVLSAFLLTAAFGADSARVQKLKAAARTDNYRVWITLLKGFGQKVYYVGSDDTDAYFRVGAVFRSYYKMPSCAAHPPEAFLLLEGKPYGVKLHVDAKSTIDTGSTCSQPVSYPLGKLDRS